MRCEDNFVLFFGCLKPIEIAGDEGAFRKILISSSFSKAKSNVYCEYRFKFFRKHKNTATMKQKMAENNRKRFSHSPNLRVLLTPCLVMTSDFPGKWLLLSGGRAGQGNKRKEKGGEGAPSRA